MKTLTNVWKLTLLSKLLLLLKDLTPEEEIQKEINDLTAEYNMEVSRFALFSHLKCLNTISLWRKLLKLSR